MPKPFLTDINNPNLTGVPWAAKRSARYGDAAMIVKIQRENRKIYLYLDKKSFTLSGYTLENLKNLLGNEFEYANQSCLINIPHISLIKNEQIYLDNNSVVYLSRSYKNSFMKKFLESAFR